MVWNKLRRNPNASSRAGEQWRLCSSGRSIVVGRKSTNWVDDSCASVNISASAEVLFMVCGHRCVRHMINRLTLPLLVGCCSPVVARARAFDPCDRSPGLEHESINVTNLYLGALMRRGDDTLRSYRGRNRRLLSIDISLHKGKSHFLYNHASTAS